MKSFLTALSIILLVSACTTRSAFNKLGVSEEQELAIENTRSGKIISKEKAVNGIYSVVYLNNTNNELNNDTHQFYVATYLKDNMEDSINFTLDKQVPIKTLKLKSKNEYSHLLAIKNEWTSNYLITFKKEKKSTINLVIDSGPFSSGLLKYSID